MVSTISLDKLITIYNAYIADSSASNFLKFASHVDRGFLTLNIDDTLNKFDETKLPHSGSTSLEYNLEDNKHKNKLTELIHFIYSYKDKIEDTSEITVKKLMKNISDSLIVQHAYLSFDKDSADEIAKSYELGDENPNLKKLHGKRNFLAKKIGVPAATTIILSTLAGCFIGGINAIAGTASIWSGSVALGVSAVGSIGLLVGIALTPAVILIKNRITREHYRKQYGIKSDNLKKIADSKIEKAEEVEKIADLKILELMNLIEKDQDEIIKFNKTERKTFKEKFVGLFKKFKMYTKLKNSRNGLHEVVAFKKLLDKQLADSSITGTTRGSYKVMSDYIDTFMKDVAEKDYAITIERSKNKKKQLAYMYMDIIAKSDLTKKARKDKREVKSKATNITKDLATSHLTGGSNFLVKLTGAYKTGRPKPKVEKIDPSAYIPNEEKILNAIRTDDKLKLVSENTGISIDDLKIFKEKIEKNQRDKKALGNTIKRQKNIEDAVKKYNILTLYITGKPFEKYNDSLGYTC